MIHQRSHWGFEERFRDSLGLAGGRCSNRGCASFADPFENSRRIADAGAALIIEGRRDEDIKTRSLLSGQDGPALTAAVEAVLGHGNYRRNARLICSRDGSHADPERHR